MTAFRGAAGVASCVATCLESRASNTEGADTLVAAWHDTQGPPPIEHPWRPGRPFGDCAETRGKIVSSDVAPSQPGQAR